MPHLPAGANANILSNMNKSFVSWMDGADIDETGPHTKILPQWGCTINKDYNVPNTRSYFKKGMQGNFIEEKGEHVKIFIQGVTESWQNKIWVKNLWVPASIVDKGVPWRSNLDDWDVKMDIGEWKLGNKGSKVALPDTTVLGKTIVGLINEFYVNPAPFMGTKIQDLLDKRTTQERGSSIELLARTIIQGIKEANVYTALNKTGFTIQDVISAARYHIDRQSPQDMGGIYIRHHLSASTVKRWKPNTEYAYIGKSIDFSGRYNSHLLSKTSYGDLTLNSEKLHARVLCVMTESDFIDFAYLVEQIFVCLFESYRSDLLVSLSGLVASSASSIEDVEAVQASHYFRQVSAKVFNETGFPGAINRASFGVSHGANYSMPLKEWAVSMEQLLFLRHDTAFKSQDNGKTIPITMFRGAKPKIANYVMKKGGPWQEMCAFQKYQAGKLFFSIRSGQKIMDGTMGPRQDDAYQLVFEIRTDGQAHPHAWSRLPSIGPFYNWDEGRSLAARIEWEYPPKSGTWRYRYLYSGKKYAFQDKNTLGSNNNYIKSIAMMQWLFNAEPNAPQQWMPRLKGCAYVLQTNYDFHTQTIIVKLQDPFTMRSGALKSRDSVVQAMKALDLDNVDVTFGIQEMCDSCAMLDPKARKRLGWPTCVKKGDNCCAGCWLMGRPCCSWTKNGAVRGMRAFSEAMMAGTIAHEGKVTSEDVALNKKYRAGLHFQPLPEPNKEVETFNQQLIDVPDLTMQEDDISDIEDAGEGFGEDDEDDEEDDD